MKERHAAAARWKRTGIDASARIEQVHVYRSFVKVEVKKGREWRGKEGKKETCSDTVIQQNHCFPVCIRLSGRMFPQQP